MMKNLRLDAGALRDVLAVMENQKTPDGYGGFEDNWRIVQSIWARILPANARNIIIADRLDEDATHLIDMRQPLAIAKGFRLKMDFPDRLFDVLTVFDPDETGRYWRCVCRVINP